MRGSPCPGTPSAGWSDQLIGKQMEPLLSFRCIYSPWLTWAMMGHAGEDGLEGVCGHCLHLTKTWSTSPVGSHPCASLTHTSGSCGNAPETAFKEVNFSAKLPQKLLLLLLSQPLMSATASASLPGLPSKATDRSLPSIPVERPCRCRSPLPQMRSMQDISQDT